jgi:hypothetical protein
MYDVAIEGRRTSRPRRKILKREISWASEMRDVAIQERWTSKGAQDSKNEKMAGI